MDFEIQVFEMRRTVVFEVSGRVDTHTAIDLGNVMNNIVDEGNTRLIVDFSGTDYLCSVGLRQTVTVLRRVRLSGGDLRIANPSHRVREVFELSGLDQVFEIYPTQVEAVGSF